MQGIKQNMNVCLRLCSPYSLVSNLLIGFLLVLCFVPKYVDSWGAYRPDTGDSKDIDFRFAIEPGKVECFHQDAKEKHNLEVNYQVIDISSRFNWINAPSGVRDLTIDFQMLEPRGREIAREFRKQEGNHVHSVEHEGTFMMCFDNSFSSVSTKIVNVEIYIYSNDDEYDRWGGQADQDFTFPPEQQAAETIAAIKDAVNKVRDDLIRVSHEQEQRRAIESRDRNLAEQNYDYVNRFSMVSIAVMIIVGFLQLYLIRSLFENKSYFMKLFKGKHSY